MQNALLAARKRVTRVMNERVEVSTPAKPGSRNLPPSSPADPITPATATPGAPSPHVPTRVSGKRPEQATPLPTNSPAIPTPGTKHMKAEGLEPGKRKLFEIPGYLVKKVCTC